MSKARPMPPDPEEVKKTIPVSVALSILTLVVTAVLFAYDLRSDLESQTSDRFRGHDMDRFIERLQVTLDNHAREIDSMPTKLPDWRAR